MKGVKSGAAASVGLSIEAGFLIAALSGIAQEVGMVLIRVFPYVCGILFGTVISAAAHVGHVVDDGSGHDHLLPLILVLALVALVAMFTLRRRFTR